MKRINKKLLNRLLLAKIQKSLITNASYGVVGFLYKKGRERMQGGFKCIIGQLIHHL